MHVESEHSEIIQYPLKAYFMLGYIYLKREVCWETPKEHTRMGNFFPALLVRILFKFLAI